MVFVRRVLYCTSTGFYTRKGCCCLSSIISSSNNNNSTSLATLKKKRGQQDPKQQRRGAINSVANSITDPRVLSVTREVLQRCFWPFFGVSSQLTRQDVEGHQRPVGLITRVQKRSRGILFECKTFGSMCKTGAVPKRRFECIFEGVPRQQVLGGQKRRFNTVDCCHLTISHV